MYNFMQLFELNILYSHKLVFIDIFCTNGCLKTTNAQISEGCSGPLVLRFPGLYL